MSVNRPPCWGIGLGRTGTNSFCEALTLLGYDRQRVAHNPPFENLKKLEGGADNGITLFYKYLDYKFPGSKFVLLWRSIEPWLRSTEFISARHPVTSRDEDIPIMRRMMIYETVGFDREKFTAAYHRHHADVRRYFASRPGDLLEMNIVEHNDGWDKLCPFLGLPVPSVPFPYLHARSDADGRTEMFSPKTVG